MRMRCIQPPVCDCSCLKVVTSDFGVEYSNSVKLFGGQPARARPSQFERSFGWSIPPTDVPSLLVHDARCSANTNILGFFLKAS